jgi:hypothetical protein
VSHTGQDPSEYSCHAEAHAEYWGDLVKWGSQHLQPSEDACCEACRSFKPDKAGPCRLRPVSARPGCPCTPLE